MLDIKANHYVDTVIYSVDLILRALKSELKDKINELNIDITGEQFIVLDTICRFQNLYQQKLSDIIMKDKSNMARILNVLENKNLIKKISGKHGNRLVYYLEPTKEGLKIVNDNMPKIKEFITDIFKNITDDEIELLHKLSKKFEIDLKLL